MEATTQILCPFCQDGRVIRVNNNDGTTFHWECDTCKEYVENDLVRDLRSGNIPIISLAGAKNSTKTNFMYFLLASIQKNRQFKEALSITNDNFVKKKFEEIYEEEISKILKGNFLPPSMKGEVTTILYGLKQNGKKSYLLFKDTPGEEFDEPVHIVEALPYIQSSSGIILMIDPLEFSLVKKVQTQITGKPEESFESAKRIVEHLSQAIRMSRDNLIENPDHMADTPSMDIDIFGEDEFMPSEKWAELTVYETKKEDTVEEKINIPVAVCIGKFDLVLDAVNVDIPNNEYFFDYRHLKKSQKDCSEILDSKSSMLRDTLPKLGTSLVSDIEQLFSNVAYFPIILAKPMQDDLKKFDTQDRANFRRGILSPLIWLLHEMKPAQQ